MLFRSFDDGTYAGARLLEIVSRSKDASAVLNALPTSFSTPELNVACKEGEPHAVVEALLKAVNFDPTTVKTSSGASAASTAAVGGNAVGDAIREAIGTGAAVLNSIDGLRVDWPDGFGLIRASNTTPVLVLRFEGHTEAALKRIESDMLALLRGVKPDASFAAAAH